MLRRTSRRPSRDAGVGPRAPPRAPAAAARPPSRHRRRCARARSARPASTSTTAATIAIEITRYAREPSFSNVDRTVVPGERRRDEEARDQLVGRAAVRRLPSDELADRHAPRPRADASSTTASSASRFGMPSAAGEALQTLPDDRRAGLDLEPADRERRRLEPVEQRRQRRSRRGPSTSSARRSASRRRRPRRRAARRSP